MTKKVLCFLIVLLFSAGGLFADIFDELDIILKNQKAFEIVENQKAFEKIDKNAVEQVKKKAIEGDAEAQYELAEMYGVIDRASGMSDKQGKIRADKLMPQDPNEALKWYTRAAEQGHAEAQYKLGSEYESRKKAKDHAKAIKWYTKAAEQGHMIAQDRLGFCYQKGRGVQKNIKEAIKWFTKAAEQGDAGYQCDLAFRYSHGSGIPQDYKEAVKWYTRAAEQGHAESQSCLGLHYENGEGVPQDYKEAVKWYTKAAEQGDKSAQLSLGDCYAKGEGIPKDYKEAIKWYTKAAEQGDSSAQFSLGDCYAKGRGVSQDYKEAIKWYTKAAEQGDLWDQYRLADKYYYGLDIPKDYKQAVKWYTKAAEQGYAMAQFNLGLFYANGQGVPQSYKEAVKWYTKAAEQGDAGAQFFLGGCYDFGYGVPRDYKEANKWYTKAAKQGNASAQLNLGYFYANGQGVIEDYVEAYKWTLLAGMNGADVTDSKAWLKHRMTAAQVSQAQQLAKAFVARKENTEKKQPGSTADTSINKKETIAGFGTGFFISKDGYLVTAYHVVKGAGGVKVYWQDKMFPAKVVLADGSLDIAVLKVSNSVAFPTLELVSSRGVKSGNFIFTLGFPQVQLQGLEAKYTDGSVSSLSGMANDPKYFQVSVPVQPGNSGGPLLNSEGQVIGVINSRLDDMAALALTGAVPQNVNYSLKSSFVLPLLDSVADIKLADTSKLNKDKAIAQAKEAVALIISTK